MAPFNLGRSVSTHSPYHGRLREGRAGIKIEVVCMETKPLCFPGFRRGICIKLLLMNNSRATQLYTKNLIVSMI